MNCVDAGWRRHHGALRRDGVGVCDADRVDIVKKGKVSELSEEQVNQIERHASAYAEIGVQEAALAVALCRDWHEQRAEIERLRTALEFYADPLNYEAVWDDPGARCEPAIYDDRGRLALAALDSPRLRATAEADDVRLHAAAEDAGWRHRRVLAAAMVCVVLVTLLGGLL